MAGGNGVDLGHVVSMLVDVLAGQEKMRVDIDGMRSDINGLKTELRDFKTETRQEFASVRSAITEYHSAVIGHGILISELQDRVWRIETHLKLHPAA